MVFLLLGYQQKGGVAVSFSFNRLRVTKVDVVILAGAPNKGPLAEVSDVSWEAMVSVGGRPMVNYVLETVLGINNLGKVVLVGPSELQNSNPNIIYTPCKDSLVANLKEGVNALGKEKSPYLLVVTSDIPLISTEAVNDFIAQCLSYSAKVYYPVVPREVNEEQYPEVQRTYFTLKEGTFTGGNIMLLAPDILEDQYELVEQLVAMRKKPAKIIKMLGVRFIFKFVRKNLSLSEIEKRAEEILGFSGKAIISNYPEVGIDVDKPSDLALMEHIFNKKNN